MECCDVFMIWTCNGLTKMCVGSMKATCAVIPATFKAVLPDGALGRMCGGGTYI